MKSLFVDIATVWIVAAAAWAADSQRWSEKAANDWYARQPWLIGTDYTPADAINQLEMWHPTPAARLAARSPALGWLALRRRRSEVHSCDHHQPRAGNRNLEVSHRLPLE